MGFSTDLAFTGSCTLLIISLPYTADISLKSIKEIIMFKMLVHFE